MQNLMKKALKTAALVGTLHLVGVVQAAGVPGQGTWETTLQARDLDGNLANGPEAFYDTALNVTWLRAANTSAMDWSAAKAWAEQDCFGLSGWRLPTTVDKGSDGCNWSYTGGTDCGYNPDSSVATGSEMAHLFFQSLGNKSAYVPGTTTPQPGYGLTNSGDFQNLQSNVYWSGTESAPNSNIAFSFVTVSGYQDVYYNYNYLYSLAVRPGDVTSAVPEPQTLALTLCGLTGLLLARRHQRAL
ncbi:DUF1566 domain-containing protein [Paucibacter sp. B2R-40]|uniref:DUF1566 domain-containing protein n=1 Tax=Paucibacter sp. B2R-40 TaxID=2893554 RepID=UPI0021E4F18D|nr:DUF1566 domain-containing protein [Paucibacter sp. B2R-40]MCV2357220.1 DUF1566 domain-containing protein [Paucibacter sp. B2R-40]